MLPFLVKLGPPNLRRFLCQMIPSADVQKLREVVDIMWDTSVRIVEAKKAALEMGDEAVMEQVGRGKDIMSILRTPVKSSQASLADVHYHSESEHGSSGKSAASRNRAAWPNVVCIPTQLLISNFDLSFLQNPDSCCHRHHVFSSFSYIASPGSEPRYPNRAPQGDSGGAQSEWRPGLQ